MSDIKLNGCETHVVLKYDDMKKYLNDNELAIFSSMLSKLEHCRMKDGKKPVNHYYICNKDEPYADDVHRAIVIGLTSTGKTADLPDGMKPRRIMCPIMTPDEFWLDRYSIDSHPTANKEVFDELVKKLDIQYFIPVELLYRSSNYKRVLPQDFMELFDHVSCCVSSDGTYYVITQPYSEKNPAGVFNEFELDGLMYYGQGFHHMKSYTVVFTREFLDFVLSEICLIVRAQNYLKDSVNRNEYLNCIKELEDRLPDTLKSYDPFQR